MQYTNNYNLKKPDPVTDFYDREDDNGNMDLIDAAMKALDDGQVAAEILTKLKAVDGSGSGLDADTLDGRQNDVFVWKDKLVGRSKIYELFRVSKSTSTHHQFNAIFSMTDHYSSAKGTLQIMFAVYMGVYACRVFYLGDKKQFPTYLKVYETDNEYILYSFNGAYQDEMFINILNSNGIMVNYIDVTSTGTEGTLVYDSSSEDREIYHEGNSYPIVEKGSNANGEYIRFADGTQVCYGKATFSPTTAGYESKLVTFPATFMNNPLVISATVMSTPSGGDDFRVRGNIYSSTTANIGLYTPTSLSQVVVGVVAWGKWK